MKNLFIFIFMIFSGLLYSQISNCGGSPVNLNQRNYPASPNAGNYNHIVGDSDQDGIAVIFRDRLRTSVFTGIGDSSLYNASGSEIYNTQVGASRADLSDIMPDANTNKTPYTPVYWLRLEVTSAGNGGNGPCIQVSRVDVKVSVVQYIGGDNPSGASQNGASRKIGVCSNGSSALPRTIGTDTELNQFFQNTITNQTGTEVHYYTAKKTNPAVDYASAANRINPSSSPHTFNDSEIVYPILRNADGIHRIIDGGIEITNAISRTNNAITITVCDTDDDGFSTFDLTSQEANTSGASFTYHLSQGTATSNTSPISNPSRYRNSTAYNDARIFSRIVYSGCSIVRQIDLSLGGLSPISAIEDLSSCATIDKPNQAEFDLTSRDVAYTSSSINKRVTYYSSLADAKKARNLISSANKHIGVVSSLNNSTRINLYGRVDDLNTGCYKTSPLTLIVVKPPTVDSSDLETCQTQGLNTGTFDLASRASAIRQVLSSSYTIQLIDSSSNTPNSDLSNNNAYSAPNGRNIDLQILTEGNTPQCLFSQKINLKVRPSPNASSLPDYTLCENSKGSEQANFNFTSTTETLINNDSNTNQSKGVFYYETEADYESDTRIPNIDNYVSETKDIIYKIEGGYTNSTFKCFSKGNLGLAVRGVPKKIETTDYSLCASSAGGSRNFNLSAKKQEIVNADPALTVDRKVTFYETLAEANKTSTTTPNDIATETSYSSSSDSKSIYIRNEINSTGCFSTSLFLIKVTSSLTPNKPNDFVLCKEQTNTGSNIFDLTTKIPEISQASSNVVRFYTDQVEASIGASSSPSRIPDASSGSSNTNNTSSFRGQDSQTIYVFIRDRSCQNTTSFTLRVRTKPRVNKTIQSIECAGNASEAIFNLNARFNDIVVSNTQGSGGSAPDNIITFHNKLLDAENITTGETPDNSIPNPDYYVSSSTNIYARVYDKNSKCLNTTTIQLIRSSTPIVQKPQDNIVCEDFGNSAKGTAIFDISTSGSNMATPSSNSSSWTYTYYPTKTKAINRKDEIINITTFRSSSSTLTAVIDVSSTCKAIQDFDLLVKRIPGIDITDMIACEEKSTNGNPSGRGSFDLKSKLDLITSSYMNRSDYNVSIHSSSSDASTANNDISSTADYRASDNDIFYVRSRNSTGSISCTFIREFSVRVNPIPDIDSPMNLETCENNAQRGTGIFNLTTNSDIVRRRNSQNELTQSRYPVRYYTSLVSANEGSLTTAIQNPTSYSTSLTSGTRDMYIRVEDVTNSCFSVKQFTLKVFTSPSLVNPPSFNHCNIDPQNRNKSFDLTTRENIIRNGLTSGYNLSWHTSMFSADNNTGVVQTPRTYQTQTDTSVFARVNDNNNNANCYSIVQLDLKILSNPVLKNSIQITEICDPSINRNQTFAQFDLSKPESEALITQSPGAEILEFYKTQCEAQNSTATRSNPPATPCQSNGNTVNPPYSKLSKAQQVNRSTSGGTNSKTIYVRAIDRSNGSCFTVGEVVLREAIVPRSQTMTDLIACDDSLDWTNSPSASINLSTKNQQALGAGVAASDYTVTYYTSQQNAESGVFGLNENNFRNTTRLTDIFVRVENNDSKCFSTADFRVEVNGPVLNNIALLKSCSDTENTNTATFDLSSANNSALDKNNSSQNQNQSNLYSLIAHNYVSGFNTFNFEFFEVNDEGAALVQPSTSALPNSYTTVTKDIYVRVIQSGVGPNGGACVNVAPLKIEVVSKPLANKPTDFYTCDVAQGQQVFFNLSSKTLEIIGTQSLNNISVSYHRSLTDAQATPALNPLPDGLNGKSNYSPQSGNTNETVYVRVSNGNSGCLNTTDFQINRIPPVNSVAPTSAFNNCDGIFNLVTDVTPTLIGSLNKSDHIVKYYLTERTANRNSDQISTTGRGSVNTVSVYRVPNSQTLVARVEDLESGCFSIERVDLINNGYSKPSLIPGVILEKCDDDTDESVDFDLTEIQTSISDLNTRQTFMYYETSPSDNTLAIDSNFYRNISSPQDIFVRVTDNISACSSIGKFQLIVNPVPKIKSKSAELSQCDLDTDLVTLFDLSTAVPNFIDSDNPNDLTIAYYKDAITALQGSKGGEIPSLYTNKTAGLETVVISFTNNKGCIAVADLNLTITQSEITERQAEVIEVCDDLLVDFDDENGVASFDITIKKRALDSKLASSLDNEHSYYENENDAVLGRNPISKVTEYRNENSPFNYGLYVRIEDNETKKCLAVSKLLRLVVNPLPKHTLKEKDLYCVGDVKEVEIGPEPKEGHQYLWSSGEITSKIKPKIEAPYTLTITSDKGCKATSSTFNLSVSSLPNTINVLEKSFNINSQVGTIKVEAKSDGAGRYVYSIDDEKIYKNKGEFDKLFSGKHLIHVKDLNGCGIKTKEVRLVGYTKFITPDGDGINDTWNIGVDESMINPFVVIYDRNSNPIARFDPSKTDWDGTLNGVPVPSSDYWFAVNYIDKKDYSAKILKGHFTLKR